MNIFSEDNFLEAFGKAYYPAQKVTPQLFELEGQVWRLPLLNFSKPIHKATFIDFFEPLNYPLPGTYRPIAKVSYLPRISQNMVSCHEWDTQNLHEKFGASPTILWDNFETWDAFVHHVRDKRSNLFSDSRRKQRKLEKELGALQFIFDDRRPEVLDTCFRWKSEQWQGQGFPDPFANSAHVLLFQELAARKMLLVSSLGSPDLPVAIHVGMLHQGRLYWWVPAYNSAYSRYSPGRLLLHAMLEKSYQLQHKEFDFLRGGEEYKWYYATHVRLIQDIGQRPLSKQLVQFLKSTLAPYPRVTAALQHIRGKVFAD